MVSAIRHFIKTVCDHCFSFVMALVVCQLPQFIAQYQDALTGAHFEAEKAVAAIREQAERRGKSLEEFITKHILQSDSDFKASGQLMQEQVAREKKYRLALAEFKNTSPWLRVWVFLKYYEHELAKKIDFKPALPLSLEAAAYALLGLILGMGLFRLWLVFWRWLFPTKKLITKKASFVS